MWKSLDRRRTPGCVTPLRSTCIADTRKGNRPSFGNAAPAEQAEALYEEFCGALAAEGVPVERGVFAARMAVAPVNAGPVTIVLD